MDQAVIRDIITKYGLTPRAILPPQKGYRNQSFGVELTDGSMVNLILYKTEPGILERITRTNAVGDFLAPGGVPVRHTHTPGILRLQSGARLKYGALYNYLPGQTIPWEAYTMEHIKVLGGTLSALHKELVGYHGELPSTAQECLALLQRMQRYFADANVANAMHAKLQTVVIQSNFDPVLATCDGRQDKQALHMDFVRGNILFTGKTITGILDFEKTSRGTPLFDIARTLAFLLVDCKYKEEVKIRKYFLQSGYNKRGPARMESGDASLLEQLVDFFLLHDFYKFLRHNPYEHLYQNEHYIRTANHLRKRNIIS